MRGSKSTFWGIVLLLGAAAMLMGRLGYLEGIGFWSLLFNVCLISILFKGIVRMRVGTILFSAAFLIIVNDELLHLEAITPWPVLGAALLGTVGLKLLFPRLGGFRPVYHVRRAGERREAICDFSQDGESISYENVFGSSVKYISGVVRGVDVDNAFGTLQIYFMDALLCRGEASINIDSAFGNVVLYVPLTWQVKMEMETVFASSGEKGRNAPDGENTLHVYGDVFFGSVEVVYV